MFNKKLKVLLSLFTTLALMTTVCFATDTATPTSDDNNQVEATSNESKIQPKTTSENENPDGAVVTGEEGENENENENGEDVSSNLNQPTETINGDIYRSGNDIQISEAVNGNVFVTAKNTVTITGQIAGDLFVVANIVNIDGAQIYGNVFALANTITLNGLIYDLYSICNNLEVQFNGTTYRDLRAICDKATLNGVVGGNVNISAAKSLELQDDCVIYQNLNYSTKNQLDISKDLVQGEINYTQLDATSNNIMSYVMSFALVLVFTLVVWLVVTFLAPKFTEKFTKAGKNRPVASLLFGLLTLIVVPIVSLLLMITIIGAPVGLILFALYALVISISIPMASISLANILSNVLADKVKFLTKAKNILSVIIVTFVLWLITLIPYVGGVVTLLAVIYGLGMFTLSVLNKVEKKAKAE